MDWNAVGHAALDVAGIFFDGADVINAIWYACEGNMEMAAASAVCAIPALGMAAGSLLMKSNKLAAAGKAVKAIAKMTQGVMGVCAGTEMAKTGFINFLDGLEAGTFDAGALLQTLSGIGIALLSGKGMAPSGRELLACEANSAKALKGSAQVQTDWDDLNGISLEEFIKAGSTKGNTRPSLPMNLQFFAESKVRIGKKGILKGNMLPTQGSIRYVPPKQWNPSQPLPKKGGGFVDRFDNIWIKGPSRMSGGTLWEAQTAR